MLNMSADWSHGEINVMPDMIEYFWVPDIIIHDLVRSVEALHLNKIKLAQRKLFVSISDFSLTQKFDIFVNLIH